MADQYDETNRGVLFLETEKESEKHPDYTGKVNVEGKEYRLAGWKRQSKNGKGFLSLSISEFQQREEQSGYEKAKAVAQNLKPEDPTDKWSDSDGEINLDDIPF